VDEHRIRVAPPPGVEIEFDTTVKPYSQIEGELVLARLTASRPIRPREIKADLRGVAIAPEIQAWAGFTLNGGSQTLQDRIDSPRRVRRAFCWCQPAFPTGSLRA
jgi:hypothetical protein